MAKAYSMDLRERVVAQARTHSGTAVCAFASRSTVLVQCGHLY
jgi:hypothetical protein